MLLGLAGKAGCGKTTVANYLTGVYEFSQHSFADPIKDMICALLSISRGELESAKAEHIKYNKLGCSVRYALQTLGTEWGRGIINKNLWSDVVEARIQAKSSHADNNVITDIRFPNEVEMLFRNNGILLMVNRVDTRNRILGDKETTHASEQYVSDLYISLDKVRSSETIPSGELSFGSLSNSLPHCSDDKVIVIDNNGNLMNLYSQIDTMMTSLLRGKKYIR